MNLGKYSKFLVAAAGALSVAATVVADSHVSMLDGVMMAIGALTAIGVYAVPNKKAE